MSAIWIMAAAAFGGLFFILSLGRTASKGLWIGGLACSGVGLWAMGSAGLLWQTKGFLVAAIAALVGAVLAKPSRSLSLSSSPGHPGQQPPTARRAPQRGGGFADVAGMSALKTELMEAAREAMQHGPQKARNGVLLHGDSGNGKTFLIEKLAEELGLPLFEAGISKVNSKFVGETLERILGIIAEAQRNAPSILFLDEVDSLLEAREEVGRSGGSGAADIKRTTNGLLEELVNLRGSGVILMAATNLLERLDEAAIREGRFDWKIEVTGPDAAARVHLLTTALAQHAPRVEIADAVVISAAVRWKGFSVKRMLAIGEQVGRMARSTGRFKFGFKDLQAALRDVQGDRARPPEGTKSLGDLVLKPEQRERLQALARRLQDAFELESAGGTLPTGLLLSGPPGTGKTETARALAKESGYAFFAVSGNDLIAEPERMQKLRRDAMSMRPAILFIDEADDLLAHRANSPHKAITNRLLTLMDGVSGRIPDLLYVAATNHPEAIDPAALRGGRFTEKLEITPPDAQSMTPWIAEWLSSRGWTSELTAEAIAVRLAGVAMASVNEILQQAVNVALTESSNFSARTFRDHHLTAATRIVLG